MVYNETLRVIKGSVHASMKDKLYKVEIFLDEDNTISHSSCTCPRGQLSCHHVAALGLFAHYNLSVTDQSCGWSAPKVNKNNEQMVQTIDQMYPSKEYRASKRKVTEQEINNLQEELASFGGAVGFTWLLAPNVPSKNKDIAVNIAGLIFSSAFQNNQQKCDYFKNKVKLSEEKILQIFELTTGQSKNPLWLTVKKFRLTASNFGAVLNACRRNSYPPSLYKRLTGISDNLCLEYAF
ncbi:hypothetical protein RI129_008244 [Pyrocoelia pectoralis]|uniref:SWIM-type domain-containing protein n=1 Tax=Pyrocoelia pectoralis TaxID=417401 RepID=A0AAN7ZFW7_9COLE